MNSVVDPRRKEKVNRYKPNGAVSTDDLPDYMNILGEFSIFRITESIADLNCSPGMIFSMCGLMMKLKWCAWFALYCSCISFANNRAADDAKQVLSSFMLSVSAVVMSYLQNPAPMTPPWV